MLARREDHARNPEEDDVIARHERIRGIVVPQLRRIVRPAERRERPQRRREPRIERVGILPQLCAALGADFDVRLADDDLAAFVAVIRRDAVTPPKLTRNAPVLDIFHPVIICQRLHLDEPLFRYARLDRGVAAIAHTDVMFQRLDFDEETLLLQLLDNSLAAFERRHAAVFAGILVHVRVVGHDVDHFQIMTQTDLEVVGVVCGRHLHDAGTEIHLDVAVRNDRDLAADKRQDDGLADNILVPFVVGMHRNAGIAEHRLGTRSRQLHISAAVRERITDVPERTVAFLIFDLGVGDRRQAVRAPVDDALAAIDQPLVIEIDKHLAHSLVTALVHREALALPVAGRAHLLELLNDAAAELAFPLPRALQKAVAADVILRDALSFHCLDDLRLGSDRRMIRAGQPEGIVPFHSAPADQDILQRIVKRVSHVKLSGDVGRRDHDGIRFLVRLAFGVEVFAVQPVFVNAVLYILGVILFCKIFSHSSVSCLFQIIFELFAAARMTQFAQRLCLDLADALARDVKLLADFLERMRAAVLQTEPQRQHLRLALCERPEHLFDLLLEQHHGSRVRRCGCVVVGDEVAQMAVLFLADWRLE